VGRMARCSVRDAAVFAVVIAAVSPPAWAGTLFGLQFEWNASHAGNQLELYALPTVDPTAAKSRVDPLPIEYAQSPIAIGSTGVRRFRRVSCRGRDGGELVL
jgi:hypothetical protein